MIITIAGQKGGVGKSTIANNLFVTLESLDIPCGIADGDHQQSTLSWLLKRFETLGDMALHHPAFRDNRYMALEAEKPEDAAAEVLKASTRFGTAIVDLPGRSSEYTHAVCAVSDIIILPMLPGTRDLETLETMRQIVDDIKRVGLNPDVRVLLNRAPHNQPSAARKARRFIEGAGFSCYDSMLTQLSIYEKSADTGLGVTELDNERAVSEFNALTAEILDQISAKMD